MTTHRVALGVEYNGCDYHGWQRQTGLTTVQQHVEDALSIIADEPIKVTCSGRTDTGVHALGQVIHFDTSASREWRAWVFGANTHLPNNINIRWAKNVSNDFHARFSARERHYRYFIYNAEARTGALNRNMAWHYAKLDEKLMREAAQALVGKHDFTSYRAVGCQAKSPIRELTKISIERQQSTIILDFKGNGFLHHMVRNMVGVLIAIGSGKAATGWAKEVLDAKDRARGGVTAPPYGLYFVSANYAKEFHIPRANVPMIVL